MGIVGVGKATAYAAAALLRIAFWADKSVQCTQNVYTLGFLCLQNCLYYAGFT